MRFVVLVLAILLLPLRGGWGDGLNTTMALEAMKATAAAHAVSPEEHAAHAIHAIHDTAGMAHDGHGDHPEAPQATPASPDCQSTCSDCQLCHSFALNFWPEAVVPVDTPRAAPAFSPAPFASVEPTPGLKPPIS